jgi:hypothetical protein
MGLPKLFQHNHPELDNNGSLLFLNMCFEWKFLMRMTLQTGIEQATPQGQISTNYSI